MVDGSICDARDCTGKRGLPMKVTPGIVSSILRLSRLLQIMMRVSALPFEPLSI